MMSLLQSKKRQERAKIKESLANEASATERERAIAMGVLSRLDRRGLPGLGGGGSSGGSGGSGGGGGGRGGRCGRRRLVQHIITC